MFLGTTYQKREKMPNEQKIYIPNGYDIFPMTVVYSKCITTFSIPRPSKIYTYRIFGRKIYPYIWYENIP
jgi:hypothetical protein